MKAILVGRHKLTGQEGLEVVSQRNINFPATSSECVVVLFDLLQDAIANDAALVFQMMPGQIAVACANIIDEDTRYRIGVIINKPGERPAGVTERFYTDHPHMAQTIEGAVKFANPRAKTEIGEMDQYCEITVDPPLRFEFSHIEWF